MSEGCPLSRSRDEEFAEEKREISERLSRIKHKLLVLSGKGGVGKTTVAVNLAAALTKQGLSVGLLDVDIHGPNVPKMLGIDGMRVDVGPDGRSLLPYQYNERLKVISIAFFLRERGDAVIWRGPLKIAAIKQFIKDVVWGELDYLVVDSPPGTGDEPLSVMQIIKELDGVVLVTTPQEVALLDVEKSLSFCRKMGVRVLGIIENMRFLLCPHCRGEVLLFGGGEKVREFAEKEGVPFLGAVPFEPAVVKASDEGVPVVLRLPESAAASNFYLIVHKIRESVEKMTSG
ncbi:MAG: Mrp/NBP35 family ATP-binding protein [Planctomycetota bacterium]|nr:Mrp/NBP35 family ATP-binding protein [Planctomycetota bacterium]